MRPNQCPKCKADLGEQLECPRPECRETLTPPEPAPVAAANQAAATIGAGDAPAQAQPKDEPALAPSSQRHLSPPGTPDLKEEPVLEEPPIPKQSPLLGKTPSASNNESASAAGKEEDKKNAPPSNLPQAPTDSKGERFIKVDGDEAVIGQVATKNVYNIFQKEAEREGEATVSLLEITTNLSAKEANIPDFQNDSLPIYVDKLRNERLILISCAHQKVALGAAYALLEQLQIAEANRRFLNFDRSGLEKSNLSIYLFSQMTGGNEEETAIVVDAFGEESRTFLDWLISRTEGGAMDIRKDLRGNRFLMLCLVDAAYFDIIESRLQNRRRLPTFTSWKINFLSPLLRHYFPDDYGQLEQQILRQQAQGKWKKNDTEFCYQVCGYLDKDLLVEELKLREFDAPEPDLADTPQFKGNQPLEDTLLYVATYFPDLTPHEFDYMVTTLLGDKTTTITVKTLKKNKEGETEQVEVEVEKPLTSFWEIDPDKYLESCRLEATSGAEAVTVINFVDAKFREDLKQRLERKHSVFLVRQFQTTQRCGLLFSATPRIAANVIRLSIDMARAHPDVFGKDWLFKLLTDIRCHFAAIESTHERLGAEDFKPPASIGAGQPKAKVYERVTQLLRQMLEASQLEEIVDGLLKQLMSTGMHDSVLLIIKGLQFAPAFDEFYWMKRLLDEGQEAIRAQTYEHLYSYIKKIGIYPLLGKLEAWLPKEEQPTDAYSQANIFALRLVVEYCSETTETFDPQYYGAWPTRHRLLAFEEAGSAADNLRRLTRWLFHPGMASVFAALGVATILDFTDPTVPFISELLVEWIYVLQGYSEDPALVARRAAALGSLPGATEDATLVLPSSQLAAATVRMILLQQIVAATNRTQQNEILSYWEELRDFMALVVNLHGDLFFNYSPDYRERKLILRKRELIRGMIKQFRELIRLARAPQRKPSVGQSVLAQEVG
jgi:hypothetical protein